MSAGPAVCLRRVASAALEARRRGEPQPDSIGRRPRPAGPRLCSIKRPGSSGRRRFLLLDEEKGAYRGLVTVSSPKGSATPDPRRPSAPPLRGGGRGRLAGRERVPALPLAARPAPEPARSVGPRGGGLNSPSAREAFSASAPR